MIEESKKDLVDRRELYQSVTRYLNSKNDGVTFGSSITFGEFLQIMAELPLESELTARWQRHEGRIICSWCTSTALRNQLGGYVRSRHCPGCGRRMKGE